MRALLWIAFTLVLVSWLELATGSKLVPEKLWDAIQKVESGTLCDPETAIGDGGRSIGPLQIMEAYYDDAVKQNPSLTSDNRTWKNCMGPGSREYSREVGCAYMERYATERRLGHSPTCEDIARIHNGGPNGFKKAATKKYWEQVRINLQGECVINL